MTDAIKEESVAYLFNLEVKVAEPEAGPVVTAASAAQAALGSGAAAAKPRPVDGEPAPVADDVAVPATEPSDDVAGPATRREAKGAPSGRRAAGTVVAKGLDGPDRSAPLQYSAPTVDGDAQIARAATGPQGAVPAAGGAAAADVNREERRKAERQARKKR